MDLRGKKAGKETSRQAKSSAHSRSLVDSTFPPAKSVLLKQNKTSGGEESKEGRRRRRRRLYISFLRILFGNIRREEKAPLDLFSEAISPNPLTTTLLIDIDTIPFHPPPPFPPTHNPPKKTKKKTRRHQETKNGQTQHRHSHHHHPPLPHPRHSRLPHLRRPKPSLVLRSVAC